MPYEYQVHSIAICLIPSTKKWISLLWKVSLAELITNHDVQMIESTCFVNLISLVWPTKKVSKFTLENFTSELDKMCIFTYWSTND